MNRTLFFTFSRHKSAFQGLFINNFLFGSKHAFVLITSFFVFIIF
jgi:hypothetical protein